MEWGMNNLKVPYHPSVGYLKLFSEVWKLTVQLQLGWKGSKETFTGLSVNSPQVEHLFYLPMKRCALIRCYSSSELHGLDGMLTEYIYIICKGIVRKEKQTFLEYYISGEAKEKIVYYMRITKLPGDFNVQPT